VSVVVALNKITKMLVDLDIDNIGAAVQAELKSGVKPQDVLKALTKGLDEVGRLYETNAYFLVELVLAAETMKEAVAILKPYLKSDVKGSKEKVIVATVRGDNHDIGKNILATMLMSTGYEIIDLGTDCPEDKIVQAVKETGARVVALSALLTTTVSEIATVDKALKAAGLRRKVKVIVGGAPLNMQIAKAMGADDYGADAVEGVRRIKALLES
jgi:methylmalonyl-CoA mutase cobalamin-binding domain/chain